MWAGGCPVPGPVFGAGGVNAATGGVWGAMAQALGAVGCRLASSSQDSGLAGGPVGMRRGAGGAADGWAPGGQERAAASGSEAANTGRRQLWHKRVLTAFLPLINTGFLGKRISLDFGSLTTLLAQSGRGHGSRLCAVVEGTPKERGLRY